MKYIMIKDWDKKNRSGRIDSLVTALSHSGRVGVEYTKRRLLLTRYLLGRGHPKSLNKNDKWNHVKITYQGKSALEIFDSDLGMDGRYLDENFTEAENRQIMECFADTGISIQKFYASKFIQMKILLVLILLLELPLLADGLIHEDSAQLFFSLSIILGSLFLLSRT